MSDEMPKWMKDITDQYEIAQAPGETEEAFKARALAHHEIKVLRALAVQLREALKYATVLASDDHGGFSDETGTVERALAAAKEVLGE